MAGREVQSGRMSRAMLDRLKTSERGVGEMAKRMREVASLPTRLGASSL
ncbi:MAG: hypothetical protein WKF84_15285 [Pyrinomonadaceae bacterium]